MADDLPGPEGAVPGTHNHISDGHHDNVVMAGTVHGGDRRTDLADPVIASVRLTPGGTLADLVVDADPPRVMVPSGTVHVITLEARTSRAVVLHAARPVVVSRRPPRPACLLLRIGATISGWNSTGPARAPTAPRSSTTTASRSRCIRRPRCTTRR